MALVAYPMLPLIGPNNCEYSDETRSINVPQKVDIINWFLQRTRRKCLPAVCLASDTGRDWRQNSAKEGDSVLARLYRM